MLRFFVLFFLLFTSVCSFGQWQEGIVVEVVDGDTYKIKMTANTIKVRLLGIDCPEHNQSYGDKATAYAKQVVLNKKVKILVKGKDLYHRVLADVCLTDGTNLCQLMVRKGLAWRYKYSKDKTLLKLEQEAKAQKIGLWSQPHPISPWEFKHKGK